MSDHAVCTVCNEKGVKKEDGRAVCTKCGALQSNTTAEASEFICQVPTEGMQSVSHSSSSANLLFGSSLPFQFVQLNSEKPPKHLLYGRKRITTLCASLAVGSDVCERARFIYEQLCSHRDSPIKGKHIKTKESFVVASIFIVAREFDLPITMDYLVAATDLDSESGFAATKMVTSLLNIELKPANISNILDLVLQKDLANNVEVTSNTRKLTEEILQLCTDIFLTQGKKPQALILAAFYLAYVSQDFVKRRKLKPCNVVKGPRTVKKNVRLVQTSLMALLKCVPWLCEEDLNVDMIPYYLQDIVRYKKVFIKEALMKDSLDEEQNTAEFLCSEENQQRQVNKNTLAKKDVCPTKSKKVDIATASDQKLAGPEDLLFAPPAFKRARQRSEERELLEEHIERGKKALENLAKEINAAT